MKSQAEATFLVLLPVLALVAVIPAARAQAPSHPLPLAAKDAKTGPAVGAQIPFLEAVDATGKRQTFETLRGPKGLLLSFSRSADWCPFCKTQLVDLNTQVEAFRAKG